MPLLASAKTDYERPEPGLHNALCVNVVDCGMENTPWGPLPKVCLIFEIGEKLTKGEYVGKPFMLSTFYTLSLGKKSNLRKALEAWRGKAFAADELKGFDLEKLVNVACTLNVVDHQATDGNTYSRIEGILPHQKNAERLIPSGTAVPEWIVKKANTGLRLREQIESEQGNRGNQGSAPDEGMQSSADLPF